MIRIFIFVVIVLLVLSYFGFNVRSLAESPTTRENFSFVTTFIVDIWNDYLKRPATFLWKDIFIKLIWNPAIENLQKINSGEGNEIPSNAPQVQVSAQ